MVPTHVSVSSQPRVDYHLPPVVQDDSQNDSDKSKEVGEEMNGIGMTHGVEELEKIGKETGLDGSGMQIRIQIRT